MYHTENAPWNLTTENSQKQVAGEHETMYIKPHRRRHRLIYFPGLQRHGLDNSNALGVGCDLGGGGTCQRKVIPTIACVIKNSPLKTEI